MDGLFNRSLIPRPILGVTMNDLGRRFLFIKTQETPNPNSLKFIPGKPVYISTYYIVYDTMYY